MLQTKFVHHKAIAWLFILPQLSITLVFFIWPAILTLWEALFYSDAFGTWHQFAGWGNFRDIFTEREYWSAIGVTAILATAVSLLTMSLGLGIALMINANRSGHKLYKTLLIWPYAVAPAVAAILWRFLCHPTLGWLTHFLHMCGINFNYLTNPVHAMLVIVWTAAWQQFSYNFLFYLAALEQVPRNLLEAAALDGASGWQRFWYVLFPLLSPTTFFLLVMNLIYAFFDTFGIIQIITRGGPGYSTTSMLYKVYKDGFAGMDMSSAAVQSVILLLMVIILTLVQFRYVEKRVHYQ